MLDRQRFLIKEQVAFLKTTDVYDIYDADSQEQIGVAKEDPGQLVAFLRWFISKKLMSTKVYVTSTETDEVVFTIRKPVSFWRERVEVYDANEKCVGYFKSKIFSLGGGFWVYDDKDVQFAEVKGDWVGWNFRFLGPEKEELGLVTKKWAGLGKELFTSADNYIVSIDDSLEDQPVAKMLLLAAALAIDIVFYEQQG
jgi:uncharacterized protein YxjI